MLEDHVEDAIFWCDPLGSSVFGEQAAESVHANFDQIWERYCVKNIIKAQYGPILLAVVKSYNCQHIG